MHLCSCTLLQPHKPSFTHCRHRSPFRGGSHHRNIAIHSACTAPAQLFLIVATHLLGFCSIRRRARTPLRRPQHAFCTARPLRHGCRDGGPLGLARRPPPFRPPQITRGALLQLCDSEFLISAICASLCNKVASIWWQFAAVDTHTDDESHSR